MAPSRKSRREKTRAPETPMAWKLPAELLREIIARSDNRTLIRFAATCNLLRCDILSPPLDRRVTQAAPCILAHLCADANKPLTLVHPTTAAASSFCTKHLSRFLLRKGVGTLLGEYTPVSSRRGLVILRRRLNIEDRPKSGRRFDMCVYDPMIGTQSFFIDPPEILSDRHRDPRYFHHRDPKYFLLTAADGIGSSFLLVIFERHGFNMKVHTASSSDTWESVAYVSNDYFPWGSLKERGNPTILSGGVIHWLPCRGNQIISYDLGTRNTGSVKLPSSTHCNVDHAGNQLYLATSSDGTMLKLLTIQGLKMFVWLQLPGGSGWSLETVIEMEEKLQSLDPRIISGSGKRIEFEGSGKRTGEVVLLVGVRSRRGYYNVYSDVYSDALIVFNLETKKMHLQNKGLSLLEIDLPSRLQSMKIFS